MEKVSLFLTTYNWPEALQLCVRSIFRQTVLPDEIIIADDGSRDETRLMVDLLRQETTIPIVHIWQKDDGYRINAIRNKAINATRYPYIIQLDGDLILHQDFVKDHLQFAKRGRFLVGRRNDITQDLTNDLCAGEEGVIDLKAFRNKLVCQLHQSLLYDSSSVKGVRGCNVSYWRDDAYLVNGYDEDMVGKGPDDKEFAARLVNAGVKAYNLKFYAVCFHFFHGEEGMVTNYDYVKGLFVNTQTTKKVKCLNGLKKLK